MPSLNPRCKRCPLHQEVKTVCVKGDGSEEAKVVIIGEAPGATEDQLGKPFMGESGKRLRNELAKNKLTLEDVYITNLVKCRPPENRAPSREEVKACSLYLEEELEQIQPELVITLGVPATKAMVRGKTKINEVHGEIIENPKVPYRVMPTFHPAYTLRDPSKLPGLQQDIRRAAEFLRGEQQDEQINWFVVRKGNLSRFIQQFYEAPDFAFDLETSGLFPHDGKGYITAGCIALSHTTWVIPGFMHPDYQRYSHSPFAHGEALKRLYLLLMQIARETKKKGYAQNGKFDNKWLLALFGDKFQLSFDTMLASHTIDENTSNDLTTLSRTYLGASDYDIPLAEKQGKSKKPMRNYQYCGRDGTYTYRLVKIFDSILKEDAVLRRMYYELVMHAARAMENIEMRGLTIDLKQMQKQGRILLTKKNRLLRELRELVGREVNWSSPAQVGVVLYDELKLPCTHKTAKGNPSTSEEAVLDLKGTHPVVDKLLEYREATKFHSTYIKGLKQYMVGDKLFITYKLHGTVTGRYASRIHSIPRDGSIRTLVTAPEGWEFVQGDLATAELRIAADFSKDPEMRQCFLRGIDVHWRTLMHTLACGGATDYLEPLLNTAKELGLGDNDFSVSEAAEFLLVEGPDKCIKVWKGWKEARKKAKAINFGFIYGMFEKKFMQTAKIKYGWDATYDEAHAARESYFDLYHGLPDWHKKQKKLCRLNGFVRSLSGRVRHLPGINSTDKMARSEAERQAINAPVQGAIGDYKAMVMIEIEEDLDHEKLKVVGEHHDAVLMIVRSDAKQEMLPKVLKIMRQPRLLKTLNAHLEVPMEGELEVGNWGAGKTFTE